MAQRSLGIVGAGQLAQMLVQAAQKQSNSAKISVLAGSLAEPAVLAGAEGFVGKFQDPELLKKFFSSNERIIFENEFFPAEFESVAAQLKPDHEKTQYFVPALKTLKLLRNKLLQKILLKNLNIDSSPFLLWGNVEPKDYLNECEAQFGKNFVLKWALGGYDGKGVLLPSKIKEAPEFLKKAEAAGYPVYAEAKIDFKSEWAVIACRSLSGEMSFFPFVESTQRNGICFEVQGSSVEPVELEAAFAQIRSWITKLADHINLVGSFGVELFLDRSNKFWVNELAPRVHNSGHYTQDAFHQDQFEFHLKAALGEKLSTPREKYPFWGMFNLLGPDGASGSATLPTHNKASSTFLHWYSKKEIRAGRKMGHLNWVATTKAEAVEVREEALKWIQDWERTVANG